MIANKLFTRATSLLLKYRDSYGEIEEEELQLIPGSPLFDLIVNHEHWVFEYEAKKQRALAELKHDEAMMMYTPAVKGSDQIK